MSHAASKKVTHAIEIQHLSFAYGGTNDALILDIPKWQVAAGETVFLHGKSGSGKSTLLNLLCGTLSPDRGTIILNGTDFSALPARKRDRYRAQHIGVVFQQFNLIPYLTVEENIQLAGYFAHHSADENKHSLRTLLHHLHLPENVMRQPARSLSVGQQQRIAIARALVNKPELIIADEPTSSLDADSQAGFMNVLMECVHEFNSTLLFVSHDHRLATHFDRCVEIEDINSIRGAQ